MKYENVWKPIIVACGFVNATSYDPTLIACYKFYGGMNDNSGNGHDLNASGTISYCEDRFGNVDSAFMLDGDTCLYGDNTGLKTNHTFACWFKAKEQTALYDVKTSGIYGTSSLIKYLCGATTLPIAVGTNGINVFEHADYFLPAVFKCEGAIGTNWHHLAMSVLENRDIAIYLDGTQIGNFTKNKLQYGTDLGLGGYDSGSAQRYIGLGSFCYGGHFKGGIDDVRFYNRALSANEVQAIYQSEKPIVKIWSVEFDACGGIASTNTISVTNGMAIGELPAAEKIGHKFLGWFTDATEGVQVTSETVITSNTTFYAHWFDTSIGNVTGATNVVWRTGGAAAWNTEETIDGWDVRSGAIGKNSETWIECVVTNGCRVSYDWKVSCEPGEDDEMYDYLSLKVDGNQVDAICGEIGWTNGTVLVEGDGEHVLRWTYQKDYRTSEGEDCGWLGRVKVDPEVPVIFDANGATSGDVPAIATAYLGNTIVIPGTGTLARSCHTFGGWECGDVVYAEGASFTVTNDEVIFTAVWKAKVLSPVTLATPETFHVTTEKIGISFNLPENATMIRYMIDGSEPTLDSPIYEGVFEIGSTSVTVKAIAYAEDWFDSACATWNLTRAPWSASECLNIETQSFSYAGNADWVRDLDTTHDGEAAMRSGTIGDKQKSTIQMPVTGAGTVSFWCKVSSECDPDDGAVYDGLAIRVDGVDAIGGLIGGEIAWTNIAISVNGDGEHVVSWSYEKDKTGKSGDDCAWLDEVSWTPAEPIPDLGDKPSDAQVREAINGSTDTRLTTYVTNGVQYVAYRTWATNVQSSAGGLAGTKAVKDSPHAWLSYALDSAVLLAKAPEQGEMKVAAFERNATTGKFDFSVAIDGVSVGENATAENLATLLGVEGCSAVDGEFRVDNVTFEFGTPVDGKVTISAEPSDKTATQFFLKVKMTP